MEVNFRFLFIWVLCVNLGMILTSFVPGSYNFLTELIPAIFSQYDKTLINSLFLTVPAVGSAIGSLLGGHFITRGRRLGVMAAELFLMGGIAISLIFANLYLILFGRFLTSICCGVLAAVVSKFTREILPQSLASTFGFIPGIFGSLGFAFSLILG